jgi:transcriptional regulator with XRE-family HTH domain
MDIGLMIKIFREHKQISREIMADLLAMSVNTYMKIETGEKVLL